MALIISKSRFFLGKLELHLLFNSGHLFSYGLLGGILGALGSGTDVAIETREVILIKDDLQDVVFLLI